MAIKTRITAPIIYRTPVYIHSHERGFRQGRSIIGAQIRASEDIVNRAYRNKIAQVEGVRKKLSDLSKA